MNRIAVIVTAISIALLIGTLAWATREEVVRCERLHTGSPPVYDTYCTVRNRWTGDLSLRVATYKYSTDNPFAKEATP